jgi:hypothetical protein
MNETRMNVQSVKSEETAAREPFFRRYQIKVKAGLRVGPLPMGGGGWPETF